jgi:hypothetical protein
MIMMCIMMSTTPKINIDSLSFNDITECRQSKIQPIAGLNTCGNNASTDSKQMESYYCESLMSSSKYFTLRMELKLPFDDSYYSRTEDEEILFTFLLSKNPEILVILYHSFLSIFVVLFLLIKRQYSEIKNSKI